MMTNTMTIRTMPVERDARRAASRRARRRRMLVNTVLEGLATIGLGTCFILCAVLIICAA